MGKPNNPKCESCFVINNKLRCGTCKYKTEDWLMENLATVMFVGNYDHYMSKEEYKRRNENE